MDENRIKHSLVVANKMIEIGKNKNMTDEELENLFLLGIVHDIGYKFTTDTSVHNKVGGEILKRNKYKYYKEVYYHGDLYPEYNSDYLLILNQADMQIDFEGKDTGYTGRIEDIKGRYGENSNVYKTCIKLINNIKDR